MTTQITKENYQELVWTKENIADYDYFEFFKILEGEEKISFLKFLLSKYPDFDDEWIHGFFNISDKWEREGEWKKQADFSDFLRENCHKSYVKEFTYLSINPAMSAYFEGDKELGNARFEESIKQPEEAVDDSLRAIFNLTSTDQNLVDVSTRSAEKVWRPLNESKKLIGGAEFEYSLFLYCELLKDAFDKIQKGEENNWTIFTKKVVAIDFKMVEEFKLLPNLKPQIDWEDFHSDADYRVEKLNAFFVNFLYQAHTNLGIPVYWAFRAWFEVSRYLISNTDYSKRSNKLLFTPTMLDNMSQSIMGFIGSNKDAAIIISNIVPYIYDFFLQQEYIDEGTFTRLMEICEANRRNLIDFADNKFWKYYGLYTWKKPSYMSDDQFDKEKTLLQNSYGQSKEEFKASLKAYFLSAPKLPRTAFPKNLKLSAVQKVMIAKPGQPSYEKKVRPERKNFGKKKSKKKKKKK